MKKKKSILGLCALLLFSCSDVVAKQSSYVSSTHEETSFAVSTSIEDLSSKESEHSSVSSSSLESSIAESSIESSLEESSKEESSVISSSVEEDENLFSYDYHAPDQLPKISITTSDNSNDFATVPNRLNKWDYVNAKISVSNCDEDYQLTDIDAGVKVRGNYTADYSKKPFRIKFNKKQKMLGLNDDLKSKSWVLLADVKDSSMLHNAYSFYLGNQLLGQQGLYASDFVPVSLEINNTYWGMYLLCEQQQVDDERVNVLDVEDLDDEQGNHYQGNDIGYFFEYDGYYYMEGETGDPTFTITHPSNNIPTFKGGYAYCGQNGYTIKSTIYADSQKNYLQKYLQNLFKMSYKAIVNKQYFAFDADKQNLLASGAQDSESLLQQYVDINSLVDTYIIQEISCDPDIGWSSFFMSVDMSATGNQKLTFQAPWDYDSAYGIKNGIVNDGLGYYAAKGGNPWLTLFMNASWFRDKVKSRWKEMVNQGVLQEGFQLLEDYASKYVNEYSNNFTKWPNSISWSSEAQGELTNTIKGYTTQKQCETYMYNWLHTRLNYLTKEFYKEMDVITNEDIN